MNYASVAGPVSVYPQAKQFADEFKKKFGKNPEPFAAQAYDSAAIIIKALEAATKGGKAPTRDAVTAAIRDVRHTGITGAVADTESLRRAKRQNVWLELDATPLLVVADGVRVRQVLFNLLSNASKFTGEGGSIILSALSTRAPLAPPAQRAGDDGRLVTKDVVWVSVADTGIGIAPEDMPKLFQEFSQVDSSASRQAQGTGLGLALSRKLVELHGGTIGAESLPGRGSTFWFMLPAAGPVRRSQV
jgi:signal transduction histidine kinase